MQINRIKGITRIKKYADGESENDNMREKIKVIKKQGINYKQYVAAVWAVAAARANVAHAAAIYVINIVQIQKFNLPCHMAD